MTEAKYNKERCIMREQLTALRREMAKRGIDAYIIPTTDFHGSEYDLGLISYKLAGISIGQLRGEK